MDEFEEGILIQLPLNRHIIVFLFVVKRFRNSEIDPMICTKRGLIVSFVFRSMIHFKTKEFAKF